MANEDYTYFLTPEQLAIEEKAWATSRLFARNGQVTAELVEKLDKADPADVLEVGLGTGWAARQAFRLCGSRIDKYVGVDLHMQELVMAREKVPNPKFYTNQLDVRKLTAKIASDWFDGRRPKVVVAYAFLKHFDSDETLKVFRTLLDCSSRFVAVELNLSGTGGPINDGPIDADGKRLFHHVYSEARAVNLLIDLMGFDVIECTNYSGTPHGHEMLYVCERRK